MWQAIKLLLINNLPLLAAFPDKIKTGNNLPADDPTVAFYLKWHDYLNGEMSLFHWIAGWIQTPFTRVCYAINSSFEDIFNAMFSLLGWDGNVASSGSPVHTMYMIIQSIGWALLGLSLIVLVIQSFGHSIKWAKILPNVIAVCLTITVLPLLMQTTGASFGGIAKSGISDVRNANAGGKTGSMMTDSLAVQPYHNNVFDLADEVRRDWGDNPNNLNYAKVNHINSGKDIKNLDMSQCFDYKGKTAKALGLTNKNEGKSHKKAAEMLKYHLVDESGAGTDAGGYTVEKNNEAGLGTVNDFSYARYKVNWIGLVGQSMILSVVLIAASIRVGKDAFELTGMNLIAPLLAYQSVRSSKKLRDLVNSICGLYMSAVLMLVVIKIFFVYIQMAPTLSVFSKMGPYTKSLAIIIIYVSGGYGLFAGINYFERITGVSQGFGQEANQGAAAAMGALGVAGAIGATGGATMKAGGWVMKHTGGASKAKAFTNNKSALQNNGKSNNKSNNNGINKELENNKSKDKANSQNNNQNNNQSNNQSSDYKNNQNGTNDKINQQGEPVNPDGEGHGIGNISEQGQDSDLQSYTDDPVDSPSMENPVSQEMDEQSPSDSNMENPVGTEMNESHVDNTPNDSAQTPENIQNGSSGIYSTGEKLSNVGDKVHNLGSSAGKKSFNYLKSHQFNMSQNGHVHGTNSESFEDE